MKKVSLTQLRTCGPELAQILCRDAAQEIEALRAAQNPWRVTQDESPPRGQPVLCAWPYGPGWYYAVAKFTGKRWLDVSDSEECTAPKYWQEIKIPDLPASAEPNPPDAK